jgi:hypothetical protein
MTQLFFNYTFHSKLERGYWISSQVASCDSFIQIFENTHRIDEFSLRAMQEVKSCFKAL